MIIVPFVPNCQTTDLPSLTAVTPVGTVPAVQDAVKSHKRQIEYSPVAEFVALYNRSGKEEKHYIKHYIGKA